MIPEVIPPPEAPELERNALALIGEAKLITIVDEPGHQVACAELVRVANLKRAIERAFEEPKKKAWDAHKAICKLENDLLAYPVEARRILEGSIRKWRTEQERVRREKQAETEAELRRNEEDRRIAEAEALAAGGQQEAAEELLDRPVYTPTVEIPAPSAPNISDRRHYGFRIVDPAGIRRDFLTADEVKIRKTVNALGPDAMELVGGIEVFDDSIFAVRATG